jgi:hypothetical protein
LEGAGEVAEARVPHAFLHAVGLLAVYDELFDGDGCAGEGGAGVECKEDGEDELEHCEFLIEEWLFGKVVSVWEAG